MPTFICSECQSSSVVFNGQLYQLSDLPIRLECLACGASVYLCPCATCNSDQVTWSHPDDYSEHLQDFDLTDSSSSELISPPSSQSSLLSSFFEAAVPDPDLNLDSSWSHADSQHSSPSYLSDDDEHLSAWSHRDKSFQPEELEELLLETNPSYSSSSTSSFPSSSSSSSSSSSALLLAPSHLSAADPVSFPPLRPMKRVRNFTSFHTQSSHPLMLDSSYAEGKTLLPLEELRKNICPEKAIIANNIRQEILNIRAHLASKLEMR